MLAMRCSMAGRQSDLTKLRGLVAEVVDVAAATTPSPTSRAVTFSSEMSLALLDPRPLGEILERRPEDWQEAPRDLSRATFGLLLEATAMLGRWEELDALRRLRPVAGNDDLGMRSWRYAAASFDVAFSRGDWGVAEDECAELSGPPVQRLFRRRQLHEAFLALHRGAGAEAHELIDAVRTGNAEEADSGSHLAYATALEILLAEVENAPIAALADDGSWWNGHVAMANPTVWAARATWLIASGRAQEVAGLAATLRRWDGEGGRLDAIASRIEGLACRDTAPHEGRVRLLAAADAFDSLGMAFEAARARVEACGLDPSVGDSTLLGPVIDELDRIGAEPWLQRARTLAGATARSGSTRVELTPREREVAGLVAEGLSNAEIAERLVISIRTVTSHLDHVYTKLGLSSRTALAAYVLRRAPDTHLDR